MFPYCLNEVGCIMPPACEPWLILNDIEGMEVGNVAEEVDGTEDCRIGTGKSGLRAGR